MGIRDLMMMLIGYGCIPLAMYNAYLGLLAYCWLSLMRPQSLVWSINLRAARITLIVAVVLIFRALLTNGPKVRFRGPLIAFLAFWAWLGVSTWCSTHVDMSIDELIQFSKIGVAVVLITGIVRTRAQLKWMMIILALCPGIWGAKFGQFFLRGAEATQQGMVIGLDNNDVALFIAMSIPMLAFCIAEIRNRWGRAAMYTASLLSVPGVILTTSRGGMLAMAAAVGMTLWGKTRWWKAIAIGAVVCGVTWLMIPAKTLERYRSIESYKLDSSARGRVKSWQTAMAMAEDRPWTGVGFGQAVYLAEYDYYKPETDDKARAAHSVWFSLLGETGYVGLGLYAVMLLSVLATTRRIIRAARATSLGRQHWAWSYAMALQCSLVTFIVGGSFLSQARFEYLYILCITAVPLALLAEQDPMLAPALVGQAARTVERRAPALLRAHPSH